jgi:two-component system sensor histidine kinase HydH
MDPAMVEPRTILCVDDNQPMRENLREILEEAGYRALVAGSCAEALVRARDGIDVGLVDVRLPDGDGVKLAGELRELAAGAPMIMLTGYATIESAVAAVRSGAWAYLVKPCSTHDLLLSVEHAVRQIEHLEEKRELVRRARLAEKLAAIGTLTAGLSHEIKNPLNAAALQLTVLERRIRRLPAEAQPELRDPLKLVQDEVVRLNRILEEFLDFARPRELHKQPVDLATVVRMVVELITPQAELAGITLENRSPDTMAASVDGGRIHQALVNLVLNALQATPHGGTVRIDLQHEPGTIVLAVEDTGAGIPEDLAQRVFEPFFTTKSGGSGLGLPLVHGVVDQHGGSISVGRGHAGGARFVIRLPDR